MAVFAFGGEADSYNLPPGHSFAHEATAGRFEANASRNALLITSGTSEVILPFNTTLSTFWLHMYLYHEAAPASNTDYILFRTAAGTETPYKIIHNTDSTWTIQRFKSGSFSTIGTTASPVLVNAAANIDFEVVRHLTTGVFRIYKDGTQIFSFTGDTDTDNPVGQMRFQGLTTNTREANLSQVIVADESTIGWKLATLSPDGNGANTAWTNDFTAVDESTYNSADFIETNALTQTETFTVSNINAAYSTYNVKAVGVSMRASNDSGSAVNDIQAVLRTAGVNYTSANLALTKDGNEYTVQALWQTNPNTTAVWTQSEVNALEAGVRSV